MQNQIKHRKYALGDFSEWSLNDATRAVAICDFQNGKTDAEQFSARLELLRRNPRLESRPTNEAAEVMKQFYELSNENENEESGEKIQDQTARVCIKTVIEKEKARISIFSNSLYSLFYRLQYIDQTALFLNPYDLKI